MSKVETKLKFDSEFVEAIRSGEKTTTIRYNPSSLPAPGSHFMAVTPGNEEIAMCEMGSTYEGTVGEIADILPEDDTHPNSPRGLASNLNEYYVCPIAPDTSVTLLSYTILEPIEN